MGAFNKLFVANGRGWKAQNLRWRFGQTPEYADIGEDAENVRYDPAEKRDYGAFGGDEGGGIAVLDAAPFSATPDCINCAVLRRSNRATGYVRYLFGPG